METIFKIILWKNEHDPYFFFFIILLIIIPTHQIVLGVLGVGGLKSISYLTVRDFTS